VDLARVIDGTVAGHLRDIIARAPTNLGPQTLALYVYEELRKIIRPPSEALGLWMRKVVAYWVILHVPGDRFKFEGSRPEVVHVPNELVELRLRLRLSNNQRQLCFSFYSLRWFGILRQQLTPPKTFVCPIGSCPSRRSHPWQAAPRVCLLFRQVCLLVCCCIHHSKLEEGCLFPYVGRVTCYATASQDNR
jgi:hypothetical protein